MLLFRLDHQNLGLRSHILDLELILGFATLVIASRRRKPFVQICDQAVACKPASIAMEPRQHIQSQSLANAPQRLVVDQLFTINLLATQ